jgi:hypothetical protein
MSARIHAIADNPLERTIMTKTSAGKTGLAFLAPLAVAAVFTAGITYGAGNPASECQAQTTHHDALAAMSMAMQKTGMAGPRAPAETPAERAKRERRQKVFDDFWRDFTRDTGS